MKVNLWDCDAPHVLLCITTNGYVKGNGEAVMGRGCALQAKTRYPDLPELLGANIKLTGNITRIFEPGVTPDLKGQLCSFPVKENWWEEADLELIEKSAKDLVGLTNYFGFARVYLPRPGCGNGKLDWDTQVRPILEPLLDDRFIIVDF